MKKIISFVLACVMALSLSVVAFAAGNETKITGTTNVPTINVTVPTSGAVTINPYSLKVTVNSKDYTDQIVSVPAYLKSTTLTALRVSATVTGEVKGNAKLATATTQGAKAPTTNSVFLYLEAGKATEDDGTGDPTWAASYDSKAANQVLVSAKATTKADIATLDASDGTDANATLVAFRLNGDAVTSPAVAWTADDTVDVTIAFSFLPTVVAAP